MNEGAGNDSQGSIVKVATYIVITNLSQDLDVLASANTIFS